MHEDKYNDPRVRITPRGIAIILVVAVLGVVGSLTSIYMRRTQLGQTRDFFGNTTVTALQLAERIELVPLADGYDEPIDLTATPGLGHLRRALLDERHFNWERIESSPATQDCSGLTVGRHQIPACIRLRLSDPTLKRFDPVELDLDLAAGWVGLTGVSERVATIDHVRPKLQHHFDTIINVQQKKFDER